LAMLGKVVTVVLGGLALFLALRDVRVIYTFVLFAWSGLACAFAPVVLCSLFWKGTTRAGAIAGMVGGFLTSVVWVLVFKEHTYDLYEMLPGFAVAFALVIGVSLVSRDRRAS
jgi:sodium/proline symporter